ncbi:hypothetical protein RRG08_055284 [Elysia crispata]|uniref:Uncharacterized protein n=1 Tax=Elysia crispata TaxID=231223 RepID=A0AAE1AMQ0_9GAST|nr:hypothetical protein RRG08_055284 [Elysia crispata]
MSNRVSPEPGYEMSEKACVPKDSGHLFQLSSQDHPQQQQQQQQQQKQQQQQQQSDNIYIIETGEDEETSHPQGDEYLRAVTPADALFQSDPVVTLPEESAAPEAGTEDQSEQSQDQQVDDYVRISRDDNNQSPLLAENNTAASTVTAPVVVVQGRLPPLEPRPPQEPPVADASFESGTGFTDTATTTALDLGVGEAGGREQTTNQLGWSLPGAGIGNQAPYSSHSTSSAAAAAEEAPVSDWEFNTGQGKGPDNQTRFIQLRESEDSTLRERQTTRPSQPEMSAMNSRPNSAKRESEVIGGE